MNGGLQGVDIEAGIGSMVILPSYLISTVHLRDFFASLLGCGGYTVGRPFQAYLIYAGGAAGFVVFSTNTPRPLLHCTKRGSLSRPPCAKKLFGFVKESTSPNVYEQYSISVSSFLSVLLS